MVDKYYNKYIRIPPDQSVDIRSISPIISHPLFNRLIFISQLGSTLTVFPGATHNRFEHSLGVYSKTLRFCQRMLSEGFLNKKEAINIPLFALLHDIGHGPFSHVIEKVTGISGDEDENGLVVLESFRDALKKSGGDFEFIKSLFQHKNPAYKIVMDKNMGMDKLDYLERDVYHLGFGQRPDVESVLDYLVFFDNKLVIDKKSLEAAKQIQSLYMYMYKEAYLHKSALIAQRFIHKIIKILVTLENIDLKNMWQLNDHQLLSKVYSSSDPRLKILYKSYVDRSLPKTGLVVRLKDREFKERIAGKKIKVIGMDMDFFNNLEKYSSPEKLEKIEDKIAEALGVEGYKIVVIPILTPWRFVPEDILYHDHGKIYSLRDTHKEYFVALKSEMNDYLAVRVCILGDRELIYKNYTKILKILKSLK